VRGPWTPRRGLVVRPAGTFFIFSAAEDMAATSETKTPLQLTTSKAFKRGLTRSRPGEGVGSVIGLLRFLDVVYINFVSGRGRSLPCSASVRKADAVAPRTPSCTDTHPHLHPLRHATGTPAPTTTSCPLRQQPHHPHHLRRLRLSCSTSSFAPGGRSGGVGVWVCGCASGRVRVGVACGCWCVFVRACACVRVGAWE
jgi:hypothetical protein